MPSRGLRVCAASTSAAAGHGALLRMCCHGTGIIPATGCLPDGGGQILPPAFGWCLVAMGNLWVSPGDGLSPSPSPGKWLLWQRFPPTPRQQWSGWGGDCVGRGPQQWGQPVTPPCHPTDPGWASINRGVLICDECCSVHRSLGRHISIVKHLRHSPWPATLLQVGADPMGTQGRGHTGPPNTHQTPPAPHRWCTPWQAMGQTPSGSTHCWIQPRCRVGAGRQTPRTKCSKCPPWRGEGSLCWSGAPSSPPAIPTSPTKSEFIRAKYQMLAFVHKLPCRDDDGVTAKDLSKVGCGIGVHGTPTGGGDRPPCYPPLPSSAIALECADGQPGDLPASALAGRPGQLLPPGERRWGSWGSLGTELGLGGCPRALSRGQAVGLRG